MTIKEKVAQQFRLAYTGGACDPDDCIHCDCFMDEEGRGQIHSLANSHADLVIGWITNETR